MHSDGDDGGSDGDGDISFDVLETVSCCLLTLCEIHTTTISLTKRTKIPRAVLPLNLLLKGLPR